MSDIPPLDNKDQDSTIPDLPSLDEIRRDVANSVGDPRRAQRHFMRRFNEASVEAQRGYAHLQGLKEHYKHKVRWSNFLMIIMAFMVGFQSYLLFMVGSGAWNFSQYDWLLPALLVQNLAQVIGLAVFVVKALFKEMKLEA